MSDRWRECDFLDDVAEELEDTEHSVGGMCSAMPLGLTVAFRGPVPLLLTVCDEVVVLRVY